MGLFGKSRYEKEKDAFRQGGVSMTGIAKKKGRQVYDDMHDSFIDNIANDLSEDTDILVCTGCGSIIMGLRYYQDKKGNCYHKGCKP